MPKTFKKGQLVYHVVRRDTYTVVRDGERDGQVLCDIGDKLVWLHAYNLNPVSEGI